MKCINNSETYGFSPVEHLINDRYCAESFSGDFFIIISKSHSSFIKYWRQLIFCPADRLSFNIENVFRDLVLFRYSIQYNIFFSSLEWMDAGDCISIEKLCQCIGRRGGNAYRTESGKNI